MGERVVLKATDGFQIGAYVARPTGEPKAALIVVQEIFGVTPHIRSVTDDFAKRGFLAIAPSYFDRYEREFEVSYDEVGSEEGKKASVAIGWDHPMTDTAAAVAWLKTQTDKKIGVVGYCWGGSLAWLAASRVEGLSATVGYYGRLAATDHVNDKPKIPVMMHFGDKDPSIPREKVAALQAAHPEVPVFHYDAGHAFNRSGDPHYVPAAAELALSRTLEFFGQHLGWAG